ncbi:MAG: CCA tRNA nucleotidyltransferase [Defluviitaleaceae bacterium]|nr:CCA tRNA nucleotidyltransferase [Defluviitaleaceae bacterium]
MPISLPADVSKIIDTLMSHGHDAYIVGGCVRDSIRGVLPKDWDITTSALPAQVLKIFPRTFETGIKHGTITVLINRQGYEVTTYRIDGEYLDNRRPDNVVFTTDIEEDLSRRDFTINAIAYNPASGYVDPHGGRGDIIKKIIRCVGNPIDRFGEDALRMLRAIRFAGQLGFIVDKPALDAIVKKQNTLANISVERIKAELTKLLASPHVEAVSLLVTTGLLPYTIVGHTYGGDIEEVITQLKECPPNEPLRLALFLGWSGKSCPEILRSLRFDNKTIREVSLYVSLLADKIPLDRYEIKKYLRQMLQASFENLLLLQSIINPQEKERLAAVCKEARDIQAKNECYTLGDLSVKGEDLIAAGFPPGKAIGDKLEELLDMVMREPGLNGALQGMISN